MLTSTLESSDKPSTVLSSKRLIRRRLSVLGTIDEDNYQTEAGMSGIKKSAALKLSQSAF